LCKNITGKHQPCTDRRPDPSVRVSIHSDGSACPFMVMTQVRNVEIFPVTVLLI
jgi:hypothetical protein